MAKKQQKKKVGTKQPPLPRPKEFLDLIAPAAVQFNTDSFVLGGTYRCVMVLRSYPPTTEQLALLSQLGELGGVTLHLTARQVTAAEENAILHTATNKSRMERGNLNNMKRRRPSSRMWLPSSTPFAGNRSRCFTARSFLS